MTAPAKDARKAAVLAAMDVAEDLAAGRLQPAQLEQAARAEFAALAAVVVGPDDPAWETQLSIARQVLALDGIPVDELAEWLAVTRTAQGIEAEPAEPSWIEQAMAQMGDGDEPDEPDSV